MPPVMVRGLAWARLGAPLLLALLGACATPSPIVEQYDAQGAVVPRKRYAKYVAIDLVHRARRIAYRPAADADFGGALSADQQDRLAVLGRPQLIRLPFHSRDNELVEEWVYLYAPRIAQFVEGTLVYEGELTDYERTLIQHGYPDSARELLTSDGGEFAYWTYKEPLELKGKTFAFDDGKLIDQQRYE